VGGTLILILMEALSKNQYELNKYDVKWLFIPCLNFYDQPNNGKQLGKTFRDKNTREVDWCLSNSRPETVAFVDLVNNEKPILTYALHDEYHCAKSLPLYFVLTKPAHIALAKKLRSMANSFGYKTDRQ
jgi:hypothetical protein